MADTTGSAWRRARVSRSLIPLVCAVGLFGLCGAGCPQVVRQYKVPTSSRPLTLSEVALRINENSGRVQSLSSTNATLSGPQFPSLKASLAVEKPRRLRIVAEKTGLTGSEFDLGSNDDMFWFWVKRSQPPALYYCRHEQFAASAAQRVIPIEPEWLVEAMGLVTIDPAQVRYDPADVGGGRVRIEANIERPIGTRRKVLIFDDGVGAVTEQHVYDASGVLLASVLLSGHERDEASGAILPHTIDIQWPATQFAMKIQLHELQVNHLTGDPAQLWVLPEYRGWPPVDLADPRIQLPPLAASPQSMAIAPESEPGSPGIRGLFRRR